MANCERFAGEAEGLTGWGVVCNMLREEWGMSRISKSSAATARMASYRQRMRAAGLRPVQIWVPDTRSPEYIEKVRQQCLAVAAHDPAGDEIMDWIEKVYEWPEP